MEYNRLVNSKYVLSNLKRELGKLNDSLPYYGEVAGNIREGKLNNEQASVEFMSLVADVQDFSSYWTSYCKTFDIAVAKDIEKLETEKQELKEEIAKLRSENNILKGIKEKQDKEVSARWKELADRIREQISLIDDNKNLIAASAGNREKQKHATGSESNRFIQELDTEELIRVYRENGYSIPKEVKEFYKRKYNITYNGLRERLIKAGVWVGRR